MTHCAICHICNTWVMTHCVSSIPRIIYESWVKDIITLIIIIWYNMNDMIIIIWLNKLAKLRRCASRISFGLRKFGPPCRSPCPIVQLQLSFVGRPPCRSPCSTLCRPPCPPPCRPPYQPPCRPTTMSSRHFVRSQRRWQKVSPIYILTNGRSLTDACTSKYHDDDHDLIVFIIIWRHSMTARNASRAWEKLGKKLKLPVCNLLFQMFAKCDDYDLLHIWNLIFGTFTLVTMILKWNSICATPKAPVRWWWSGHWDAEFAFANFHQDLRNVWNKICVMLKPWFAHWSSHA